MATQHDKHARARAIFTQEQARADVYALLGALLATPPNQELLNLLRGIAWQDNPENGALTPVWRELSLAAQIATPGALHEEYQNLFIGVGRGEILAYASWYKTGSLMDKPLAALRTDLAGLGYSLRESVSEPEDHAAALCEIMGAIISENRLPFVAQMAFYENHLASWMERFLSDLAQAKSARFYKSVGELGRCFMQLEKRYYAMA
jgi:TorA maturation chaperone TorD